MNNESGFSIAEGLVSISSILIVTSILFPLMFHILGKQEESKQRVMASQLLYENIEEFLVTDNKDYEGSIDHVHYVVNISQSDNKTNWKACIYYEDKQKCIIPL